MYTNIKKKTHFRQQGDDQENLTKLYTKFKKTKDK